MVTTDLTEGKSSRGKLILAGLVALAYGVLGWLPNNYFWGINHLYFHSSPVRLIFGLSAVMVLFLPVHKWLQVVFRALDRVPAWLRGIGLLAITAAALTLFRVAVHSLGDGYQRAFEITEGQWYQPTQFLDYLVHAAVYHLFKSIFGADAITAMAVTSIAAGIGFVYLLWSQKLFAGWKKVLFSLAVVSLGSTQLFFGYAESYTLVYLFAFWYLASVFRDQQNTSTYLVIILSYLLAGFSHQMGMVILLPSLLYVTYLRFGTRFQKLFIYPLAVAAALAPYWVIKVINRIKGFEEIREPGSYFLPLIGQSYGVLNLSHLLDVLNQVLLTAPLAVMLLPLVPFVVRHGYQRILALLIIIPSLLFLFWFNPELGMARDWDAFSIPTALIAIGFMISVIGSFPEKASRADLKWGGPIAVSMIMLFSWILINNSASLHLTRATYLLDHTSQGKRYGYELLAHYYYNQGDHRTELEMLEKIEPGERTARVYGKMAQAAWLLGRSDQAYDYAWRGVGMPDNTRLNMLMAGVTASERKEWPRSIRCLRSAALMAPNDQPGLCKLGDVLTAADSLEAAVEVFRQAITLDRDQARPFFGLAEAYYKMGDMRVSEIFCREGLRRDATYPGGQELLERLQAAKGAPQKATEK